MVRHQNEIVIAEMKRRKWRREAEIGNGLIERGVRSKSQVLLRTANTVGKGFLSLPHLALKKDLLNLLISLGETPGQR